MKNFWQSDTAMIVRKMRVSGNQAGVIALWKNMVAHWAQNASVPDAEAVKAFLPLWQVRPCYTAAELAPIFPVLAVALGLRERPLPQKSAKRLENELKFARLPHFERDGKIFFVVEQCHKAEEFANAQY